MIEKVTAQIVAEIDESSFKKAQDDVKVFARDNKKELDKNFLFAFEWIFYLFFYLY